MKHLAASFTYPFRGKAQWLLGALLLGAFPLSFPLIFGYAVRCLRSAAADPQAPPPSWRPDARLLLDGLWSALQAAVLTIPFAVSAWLLAGSIAAAFGGHTDPFLARGYAMAAAVVVAGMPWGLLMLFLVPPTLGRFTLSGRPSDLAAAGYALATARRRFIEWNLVLATIVTAWLVGLAATALPCVGFLAGVSYAILVSAHASASLVPQELRQPA